MPGKETLSAAQSAGSNGGETGSAPPVRPGSPSIFDNPILASFRPVSSETDLRRIIQAAQTDNHLPICPTHFAEKDGQVVGYASIGIVPMVFAWVHTKQVRARESFALLSRVEQVARGAAPVGIICTPCTFESPFFKFMPKLGYSHGGHGGIFLKNLKGQG